jgi:LEA14-like dessication related protein
MRSLRWFLAPGIGFVVACSTPEPPKVTPTSVAVTGADDRGLLLVAKLAVENPNGFELSAQSVAAKVVVAGTVDLGIVTVDKPFTLPAKTTTNMEVPLTLSWQSAAPLIPLAQKPTLPFTVDGTVQFSGRLAVALPFHVEGTINRDQILKGSVVKLPLPL